MAKFTDAVKVTLKSYFNAGDQPTEAQFAALIDRIQEGIEEHQHDSTGDGDGTGVLDGPITIADGNWVGVGAALERFVFNAAGSISVIGAKFGVGTLVPDYLFEATAAATSTSVAVRTFSVTDSHSSRMSFMKSHHDTIGTLAATINGDYLGQMLFYGVSTAPGAVAGGQILSIQRGAAGAANIEADLIFQTFHLAGTNTNQLVLDGGTGFVGVGCVPTTRLDVQEDLAGFVGKFSNDGNNDDRWGLMIQCGLDTNPAARLINFADGNGTTIGYVIGSGAGGVTYFSASDERIKDIQGDLTAKVAMAALRAITPKRYKGKGGKKMVAGFIAQDVMAATEGVAGYNEEEDLYGLDYGRLTAYLWAQNKALLERIEQLEAR